MAETARADADGGWKDIIEQFTEEFLEFYFPEIYDAIDFSRGYEFLDTELRRCAPEAQVSHRQADKLLKVFLKTGEEQWLLIHIEVQGETKETEEAFAERMFVYRYRLYDYHRHRDIVSLVVLTDASPTFRPHKHEHGRFGSTMTFVFPSVKLIDYEPEGLDRSDNPFARVTEVHQRYLKLGKNAQARFDAKLALSRRLYERGHSREEVVGILLFIDALMRLPERLEIQYRDGIEQIEGELGMPYVSTFERLAKREGEIQGLREAVLDALEARFGDVPYLVREAIEHVGSDKKLRELLRKAILVKTLDEFSV